MATLVRMTKNQKTETDIAVLQVQVKNIEDKVLELKDDLKEYRNDMTSHSEEMKNFLKEMRDQDIAAHQELGKKVSALEKWRWMLMGAGVVIGSLGFDFIGKLLTK